MLTNIPDDEKIQYFKTKIILKKKNNDDDDGK